MQVTQHSTVLSLEGGGGGSKGLCTPGIRRLHSEKNRNKNRWFAPLPPGFENLTTAPQYISPIITHTYCGPMCRWPFKAGRWCSLNQARFTNVTWMSTAIVLLLMLLFLLLLVVTALRTSSPIKSRPHTKIYFLPFQELAFTVNNAYIAKLLAKFT